MADVALWSGATGAGNGTSWADAYTTLAAVIAAQGSNPTRVFVASDHVELTGAVITFQAIYMSVYQIISVDRASGFPPTVEQAGARIGSTNATNLTISNGFYSKGVFWTAGEGSTATRNLVFDCSAGYHAVRIVGGGIELRNTGSSSRIVLGTTSLYRNTRFMLEGAEVRFGNAGQGATLNGTSVSVKDGALAGSAITEFIRTIGIAAVDVDVSGFDMSAGSASMNMLVANMNGIGQIKFDSCKMPAGWTGGIVSGNTLSQGCLRALMINCDSADTNYRLITAGRGGGLRTDTAVYRSGGASDGTTPISWLISTSAGSILIYPLVIFDTPSVTRWNDTVDAAVTISMHVLTDGVTLKDDEAWLEVTYLDDAGFPLGAVLGDERPSQLSPSSDQESSAATWTSPGIAAPVKQKLSVTFTPRKRGYIQARVRVARPSSVIYVCPEPELS